MNLCHCGAPISIKKTSECKRCYNRRYARENVTHTKQPDHSCECGELIAATRRRCADCARTRYAEQQRARSRSRRAALKGNYYLTHHISKERFEDLRANGCMICGEHAERMVVDHDHACCAGKFSCGNCVRGVLCERCNMRIGLFNDDVDLLQRAISYLTRQAADVAAPQTTRS